MKKKVLICAVMVVALLTANVNMAYAVSGNTVSTETFQVHADSGNASIKLKSYKGVAYVEKRSIWGTNPITGYEEEEAHGFYNVTITGPGKNETIK